MRALNNPHGTSLIEVLVAICLTTVVVVSLSLAFPIASKNIAQNRQRWVATQLASSQIANFKSQPYDYVDATDASFLSGVTPACDCTQANFAVFPSTTTKNGGTTYQLKACVNYVLPGTGNTWTPQCPSSGDTGYKNIQVRAFWSNGAVAHEIAQGSSMTRS